MFTFLTFTILIVLCAAILAFGVWLLERRKICLDLVLETPGYLGLEPFSRSLLPFAVAKGLVSEAKFFARLTAVRQGSESKRAWLDGAELRDSNLVVDKLVLRASLGRWLCEQPHLIPQEWRKYGVVTFLGDVYGPAGYDQCTARRRYYSLRWNGEIWIEEFIACPDPGELTPPYPYTAVLRVK